MQALATANDTLLRGEYRLLETLGGSESRVYLARREVSTPGSNASSTSVVARLWKPSAELLRERGAQALFERAAAQMRSASLLRHPVLAMVETSGALDDGTLYIVSEHVEGKPLDALLNSAGIPPLPSVIDLAYRICSALNTAHRNGLAHAALHPSSVIVRPSTEGSAITRLQAKLIDFGTPTCMFGSPPTLHAARYMAPEQLELSLKPAIDRAEPTVRMNVYGCGALLYAMCTGGPPLPGKNVDELLVAHAAHKIVPPSRINPLVIPALDAIILKALDPQPRARFANAAELANALISIRFERSSSGVRPRAVDSGGFEERPTSKTDKLPEQGPAGDGDFVAFPSERPTAEIHVSLPTIPPLPRLSPPPPSVPPALPPLPSAPQQPVVSLDGLEEEDITAEAPLPEVPLAERRSENPEPPAVLARPARRSMAPGNDLLSRIPPIAFIALAALISISVILAVISQPSDEPKIEVTPLPAPAVTPPVQRAPAPPPTAEVERAGANAPSEQPQEEEQSRVDPAPRNARPRRAPARAAEAEARALPEPEEPIAKGGVVLREEPEAVPAPKAAPIEESSAREPEERQAAPAPAPQPAPQPAAHEVATTAPKRSAIEPLPEKKPTPIAPLPEKATARFSDVAVKGSLATSQVRRGIERLHSGTQSCYRAVLATRPSSLGDVSVEVVVDERGRARSARVTGAVPSSLKTCLEATARKLSVPPPDTGTVTATWKLAL